MRPLLALPFGAMLLIAVVPYKAWAIYSGTFAAWQAHRAAIILVLAVLALAMIARRLGCSPAKASVIVAIPVVAFLLQVLSPVVVIVLLAASVLAAVVDRHRRYENVALTLAIMGAVLSAGAVTPVLQFAHGERKLVPTEAGSLAATSLDTIELIQSPSIIHIVLDGYGAPDTLAEVYGHDTGPFFGELEQRGFVVMRNAVSPYSQTLPSMASIMSAAPVEISDYRGRPRDLRTDLGHTLRHGPVPALLEASGYTFARSESGYGFVDFEDGRRVSTRTSWMTPLEAYLIRAFGDFFGPVHNDILKASLAPGTLSDLPQPFFYYQHTIAPHPPFSLSADGTPRASFSHNYMDGSHFIAGQSDLRDLYIEGYREKALFTEAALLAQLDALPEGPKIVIIHGDHGPGAHLDHEDAGQTCLSERLRTFVAIYSDVPGLTQRLAPRSEEPFATVNIYREVLTSISDKTLPLLEPKARHLRWSDPTKMTMVSAADLGRSCGDASIRRRLGFLVRAAAPDFRRSRASL